MVAPTAESVVASEHIVAMGKQATTLWPALLSRIKVTFALSKCRNLSLGAPTRSKRP